MPILRISLVRPLEGQRNQVEELLDRLEEHYATLPGYILGFRFRSGERPDEVGRLAVWESHERADEAAQRDRTMALRSEINLRVSEAHDEWVYELQGTPQNLPRPR